MRSGELDISSTPVEIRHPDWRSVTRASERSDRIAAVTAGGLGEVTAFRVTGCPNCGAGPIAAYCATCGERQPSHADYSARAVALEVSSEFLSVDGRFWRSIVTLLSKPGLLTKEYFSGHRGRYMRPFSLFILLNVLFFFAQPYTGLMHYTYEQYVDHDGRARMAEVKRGELFMNRSHFAQHFDDTLQDQKKSLLLVAIPVLALSLMVLFFGSGRVYVEHLVFSVHVYAFMVFYLTCIGTAFFGAVRLLYIHVPFTRAALGHFGGEASVVTVLAAGMLTYLSVAVHTFYGARPLSAIARAAALFAIQVGLIIVFKSVLFRTTLAAL